MKKRIIITGEKVNDVGYRPFLLAAAESFEIERFFADNTSINGKNGKQEVYALVDSIKEKVTAFLEEVSSKTPKNSSVEKIEDEDYEGNVMKTEGYYRYLTAMQLSKIATYGGKMLDKQDSMLGKQDSMLDKQDTTIEILKSVKENTGEMLEKQDSIKSAVDHGFSELKEEHVKTRETSMEIFHSEVQGLRQEITFLRSSVEEIRKKVGIT